MATGTRIKICGITNWDDAAAAVDAGADILGFVCTEHSPRAIDPADFAEIADRLPDVTKVGVFDRVVDPRWRIEGAGILHRFHQIQYYQDSLWTDVVRRNWDMSRKIKGFHIVGEADLRRVAAFNGLVQSYLLNLHVADSRGYGDPDRYGWELARAAHQYGKRLYLAGGLTPENVTRAVARVLPYAVDVNVGVEREPGKKDPAKMREFVAAVRLV